MNTLNYLQVNTFQKSTGAKTNTKRHSKRPAVFALVLTLGLLVGAIHGYAANLTWTNGSGDFFTAEKWDPAQTPVSGDATFFRNNSSYTVGFSGNATDDLIHHEPRICYWIASTPARNRILRPQLLQWEEGGMSISKEAIHAAAMPIYSLYLYVAAAGYTRCRINQAAAPETIAIIHQQKEFRWFRN